QGDLGADRHTIAQLVGGNRLAGARDDRALARNHGQVLGRRVHLLAIVHRLADAHVEHDLFDARNLHGVLVAELLGHLAAHDLIVVRLEPRLVVLRTRRARRLFRLRRRLAGLIALALGRSALARLLGPGPVTALARLGLLAALGAGLLGFCRLCRFFVFGHGLSLLCNLFAGALGNTHLAAVVQDLETHLSRLAVLRVFQ